MTIRKKAGYLCFCLILAFTAYGQVEVTVEGISDGYKNSQQRDRDEAILDAKLKAIERAGVSIEAVTVMENFKLKSDWVESKAKAVILPGFNIIDVGYGADGLYHVVLSGKVSSSGDTGNSEGDKKFRMAKILLEESGDRSRAISMLREVVDDFGDCSAADDALYLLITNETNQEVANERFLHLRAYYPDSPFISAAQELINNWNEEILKRLFNSMKFVEIPSGSFLMGSPSNESGHGSAEGPQHRVQISSFKMMTTEVTQAPWEAVMGSNPSNFKGTNLPVEKVSWNDVQEFIKKLNRMDPGKEYRLPTEAEWEYACRAGTKTKYYSGSSDSDLGRVAWYNENSSKTHPVGQKEPNRWGLYDMHGNVWEWCEDWYDSNYYSSSPSSNPKGPGSGTFRVLRGGSWYFNPGRCPSADRSGAAPDFRNHDNGFRVVCSSSSP
ncbi:MAG: formylglycine-generating enzyme family protein [Candidatus Electryonea clarkiae]|nr:formylglycine-generating enzyme family protein [Candidatus Electryonea clarkiae]MDP8286432.1 formylglycine-generating enzyme family protein [Candidatus Electryonea clarkiae]